jgi:hypothetical protein
MSTTGPGTAADGTAAAAIPVVHALFEQEIAAQEAVGLLVHHGFRREGIRLVPASSGAWRRTGPAPRAIDPPGTWRLVVGAVLGLVVAAAIAAAAGTTGGRTVAAAVAGAVLGAAVASLATRSRPVAADAVVVPDHGAVVAVRTVRTDDARLVLARADGQAVEPAASPEGDDAEPGDRGE